MDFDALLTQVRDLLQRQGRVSYRALKLRYQLDDEALAALTDELIYAARVARDEDGRVLVWVGEAETPSEPTGPSSRPLPPNPAPGGPHPPEDECRQLTVLFYDLVDWTVLARQLDSEAWRARVWASQDTCATVSARFGGILRRIRATGSWSTVALPRRMQMMPGAPYRQASTCAPLWRR
jgi:class 3 adenylate cyclase